MDGFGWLAYWVFAIGCGYFALSPFIELGQDASLSAPTPRWVVVILLLVLFAAGNEIRHLKKAVREMTERLDNIEDAANRRGEDG